MILYTLLGLLAGLIIMSIIFIPQVKQREQLDAEIKEQNKSLQQQYNAYIKQQKDAEHDLSEIKHEIDKQKGLTNLLKSEYTTLSDNYEQQKKMTSAAIEDFRKAEFQKVNTQIKEKRQQYKDAEDAYKTEYLIALEDYTEEFEQSSANLTKQKVNLLAELDNLRSVVNAAVEESKRRQAEKDAIEFYRIQVSAEDLKEILKLREITPYLRNPEPLNKIIWKTYYEKPTTDLIGRVVGPKIITGIYKITNLANQMTYIGQSVNIADRWRSHIKRGLGADTPTRNKLYPAMEKYGVENFSFEILEQCDKTQLDEKEKYWIEFYHGKDFGYNVTAGNG